MTKTPSAAGDDRSKSALPGQPTLLAMAEVTELLGVSKRRAQQLMRDPGFPEPVATLTVGRIWSYADVAQWAGRIGRAVHPLTPAAPKGAKPAG